jgi:hypothetical protein
LAEEIETVHVALAPKVEVVQPVQDVTAPLLEEARALSLTTVPDVKFAVWLVQLTPQLIPLGLLLTVPDAGLFLIKVRGYVVLLPTNVTLADWLLFNEAIVQTFPLTTPGQTQLPSAKLVAGEAVSATELLAGNA